MQRRCDRNRKRSKRRALYCPLHGTALESVSQKHRLFADRAQHLQQRGARRLNSLLLIASRTTVPLEGEWLEAFWCEHCQQTTWYHVQKKPEQQYDIAIAPPQLWQQVSGVVDPNGNPSVSEFTRRQAHRSNRPATP